MGTSAHCTKVPLEQFPTIYLSIYRLRNVLKRNAIYMEPWSHWSMCNMELKLIVTCEAKTAYESTSYKGIYIYRSISIKSLNNSLINIDKKVTNVEYVDPTDNYPCITWEIQRKEYHLIFRFNMKTPTVEILNSGALSWRMISN